MMNTAAFQIPEANLAGLQEKIAKLNKRAVKLGLDPIAVEVGAFTDIPVLDKDDRPTGELIRKFTVTIIGAQPKLNGWSFVATLEGMEGEVLIRRSPAVEADLPTRFRNFETCTVCEHCKVNRRRSETFVLQNEAGEFKQVGRQCLVDFLGSSATDPMAAASYAELVWTAMEEAEAAGSGGGFGGGDGLVSMNVFLAHVAMGCRMDGWMSRGAARKINEAAGF